MENTAMNMDMPSSSTDTPTDIGAMDNSQMPMTFFSSSSTPLFSSTWRPASATQYAGTCVFLIILAIIMRAMLGLKPILEKSLWAAHIDCEGDLIPQDDVGYQKNMAPRQRLKRMYDVLQRRWAGWQIGTSLGRAVFELLLTTVGYLLMLAVMTMNVGYFLSVLGGLFLGTFIIGDLAADNLLYQDHHC
ncbi:hypothetical protein AAE478_001482 [Parahypoxylon ruwenzoriense]